MFSILVCFSRENPLCSGFPTLLEACVVNKSNIRVSNKALSYGIGLSPQTTDVSIGNDTIGYGAGLSLENEGLSAKEQQKKGTLDPSKIFQPENKPVSYNNVLQNVLSSRNAEVLANEKGFYFFKFSDDDSCSKVLEASPWLFPEGMIILKKWHSQLVLTKESYPKVTV
ncbi:hypothetical protein QYF36_017835 [Acer negundo]|nr:hypothetical protein QYF36_017835 [Acer negundo]